MNKDITYFFTWIPAFAGMTGWKRNTLAFFAGVLMTLALPPVFALPLIIPAFSILYLLIDNAPTEKRAFADGWWWGMGWHITGLYWFCIALLTDPEKFAWLIPFCLIGLNAIIALYAGITCWLWKNEGRRGLQGIFMFTILWALMEYARGHLFTGFPWNLAGYVFTANDVLLQMASLVGVYGLTWFVVILGTIPAALVCCDKRRARTVIVLTYALLVIGATWGEWRLSHTTQESTDIRVRLVQANIEQNLRWDPAYRRQVLDEHLRLTRLYGIENIDVVIWPETAVPYAVRSDDVLAKLIGKTIAPKAHLVFGGLRVEGNEHDWRMFNSMQVVDHSGTIVGYYDKVRLVPFGEFIPFRYILPKKLLTPAGDKDFSIGHPGMTLPLPDAQHSTLPLICYEVVFPDMAQPDPAFPLPTWILNITNDAWFGVSSGPYQHFHMARMRAVEQGLPLVRVANTGVSAIVDAYGRVLFKMGLNEKGIIDAKIPREIAGDTLYGTLREVPFFGLIFMCLVLIIGQRKSRNA